MTKVGQLLADPVFGLHFFDFCLRFGRYDRVTNFLRISDKTERKGKHESPEKISEVFRKSHESPLVSILFFSSSQQHNIIRNANVEK